MANEPLKGVAPQAQVPKPAAPQSAPAQAPAATQQVAPQAPETAPVEPMRERTQENFEKLLESNNRLYQAQLAQEQMIQQLIAQQTRQPQVPQVPQVPVAAKVDPNDFIKKDPVTNEEYIDGAAMRAAMAEIQNRATRAEEMVKNYADQQKQSAQEQQEREAFKTYPDLNPRAQTFDREFSKKTRAFLTDSLLNPNEYGGRPLSFKEAADIVRAGAQPTQAQVTVAQVVEEAQPTQAGNVAPTANQIQKEQAAASVANQPPQVQTEISEEELRAAQVKTRLGDDRALAERLMHTDHLFGPNSGSGEEPR